MEYLEKSPDGKSQQGERISSRKACAQKKRNKLIVVSFGLSAVFSLCLAFLPSNQKALTIAASISTYWVIEFVIVASIALLIKIYGKEWLGLVREKRNWLVFLLVLLSAVYLFTRESPGFKIYFDEPALSNLALNIHETREAIITGSSHNEIEFTGAARLSKRPGMYPVLLANVHDLLGFRVSNAFYLNGILTLTLIALVFHIIVRFADRRAGIISIVIISASPIIATNASGGGFDLLNANLIMASLAVAINYSKNPSKEKQSLLFLTAVALSNTRYESFIYVLPVAGVVLYASWRDKRLYASWFQCVVPILFIPIVWIQRLSIVDSSNWYQNQSDQGIFSVHYIWLNLKGALIFFFKPDASLANNPVIAIVAVASVFLIIGNLAKRMNTLPQVETKTLPTLLFFGCLIIHTLLMLAYFWGSFADPVASRLAIPLSLFLIIVAALGIRILEKEKTSLVTTIFLVIAFLYSTSIYAKHSYTKNNAIPDYMEFILNHHNNLEKGNYLYISRFQTFLELYEINNVSVNQANLHTEKIVEHSPIGLGTYDAIFAIQLLYIDPSNENRMKRYLPGWELSARIEMQIEEEKSFVPYNYIRISRVVEFGEHAPIIPPYPYDRHFQPISGETSKQWQQSLP